MSIEKRNSYKPEPSNPMFRRVMEFMVSNGLHYTKYYVSLTGLDVKGQASSVQQIEASVQFNGNTYSFPMFCYDYSARKETGRIKIIYDIANHLDHRGFLYDIPDRLCVGGKNTAELRLTCDVRVIPALYTMARVWEEYDKLHNNTGERIVVVAAYRTTEKSTELMISWANKLGLNNKTNWTMKDSDEIMRRAYNETGDLYNSLGAIELRRMAARPGNSPHQTGRVFDFSISDNPAVYDWLKENAHLFGFYSYTYEKWHWEYNPSRAEVSK